MGTDDEILLLLDLDAELVEPDLRFPRLRGVAWWLAVLGGAWYALTAVLPTDFAITPPFPG